MLPTASPEQYSSTPGDRGCYAPAWRLPRPMHVMTAKQRGITNKAEIDRLVHSPARVCEQIKEDDDHDCRNDSGEDGVTLSATHKTRRYEVTPSEGDNTFSAVAINTDAIESSPDAIMVYLKPESSGFILPSNIQLHMVIMGNQSVKKQSQQPELRLSRCRCDSKHLRESRHRSLQSNARARPAQRPRHQGKHPGCLRKR